MGARALASRSPSALVNRLAVATNPRFWHPAGMQTSPTRVSGGRFPSGPKTTTGYPLPTLRVGLTNRTAWENLTPARANTR